jgi:hypothetical protein
VGGTCPVHRGTQELGSAERDLIDRWLLLALCLDSALGMDSACAVLQPALSSEKCLPTFVSACKETIMSFCTPTCVVHRAAQTWQPGPTLSSVTQALNAQGGYILPGHRL